MPNFQYTAIDQQGNPQTGTLQAGSEAEATSQLRNQGFYPTGIVEQGKGTLGASGKKAAAKARGRKKARGTTGGRIKPKVLMIFTRQLATLIDSGLPLLRGLTVRSIRWLILFREAPPSQRVWRSIPKFLINSMSIW